MKQVILILSLITLTFCKSFASDPVSTLVQKNFNAKFSGATDVSWSQANGYAVAAFSQDGKRKYAYYNQSADLVVVAEAIQLQQLSEDQRSNLDENFSDYTVKEAYKMKNEDGIRYYLVLENKKESIILNGVSAEWEIVKRTKK